MVSSSFGALRQLRSVRGSVPTDIFQHLVASLVLSCLDCGNTTLFGIPTYILHQLQSVMNAGARLIFKTRRHDHVSGLLAELHWLRAPERITFKTAMLTYKSLHGTAPDYLTADLYRVADVPSRGRLRSASTAKLVQSCTHRITASGNRSFPTAAARVCNSLPLISPAPRHSIS